MGLRRFVLGIAFSALTLATMASTHAATNVQVTINVINESGIEVDNGLSGYLDFTCYSNPTSVEKKLPFSGGTIVCPIPSGAVTELRLNLLIVRKLPGTASEEFRLNSGWTRTITPTANVDLTVRIPPAVQATVAAVASDGKAMQFTSARLRNSGYGKMAIDSQGSEWLYGVREWSFERSTGPYSMIGFRSNATLGIDAERDGTRYSWQSATFEVVAGYQLTACIDTGGGKYSGPGVKCSPDVNDEKTQQQQQSNQIMAQQIQRDASELITRIDAAIAKYGSRASSLTRWKSAIKLLISENPSGPTGMSQFGTLRNTVELELSKLVAQPAGIKPGQACSKAELGKTTKVQGKTLKCVQSKAKKSPVWQ